MKNLNELPEILEVSDLMEFFGLSRAGTYRLVRKKGFPAFKLYRKIYHTKKILD